ncbi:MAG: hypothetical protein HY007_02635 [Candidatus Sungbacteria bacterium]|nr:hypothetical protein [Candidatus Sungbacteria bacterium]
MGEGTGTPALLEEAVTPEGVGAGAGAGGGGDPDPAEETIRVPPPPVLGAVELVSEQLPLGVKVNACAGSVEATVSVTLDLSDAQVTATAGFGFNAFLSAEVTVTLSPVDILKIREPA